MTVHVYDRVRITLRDATGEWTYEQGPWRKHMKMSKERLLREVTDWMKRSQHEAKLAFAAGDLWAGLVWGAKVPELLAVEKEARAFGYETGMTIDVLGERVARIARELDPGGRIKTMVHRPHDLIIGMDIAMGPSATAIATLFRESLERVGREAGRQFVDRCVVRTPSPDELDSLARDSDSEEEFKARARSRLNGIRHDLVIIDDPIKK